MKGRIKMDYNILNFIDDEKIREAHTDVEFTPAQQILIVGRSKKRTVLEKIEVLEYLLSMYTEAEVEDGSVVKRSQRMDFTFYQNTVNLLKIWKKLLEMRAEKEGVVYIAGLKAVGDNLNEGYTFQYFSSYDKAYKYLQDEKKFRVQDALERIEVSGVIKKAKLDDEAMKEPDEYRFDNDLRLTDLYTREEQYELEDGMVWTFRYYTFYEQRMVPFFESDSKLYGFFNNLNITYKPVV